MLRRRLGRKKDQKKRSNLVEGESSSAIQLRMEKVDCAQFLHRQDNNLTLLSEAPGPKVSTHECSLQRLKLGNMDITSYTNQRFPNGPEEQSPIVDKIGTCYLDRRGLRSTCYYLIKAAFPSRDRRWRFLVRLIEIARRVNNVKVACSRPMTEKINEYPNTRPNHRKNKKKQKPISQNLSLFSIIVDFPPSFSFSSLTPFFFFASSVYLSR